MGLRGYGTSQRVPEEKRLLCVTNTISKTIYQRMQHIMHWMAICLQTIHCRFSMMGPEDSLAWQLMHFVMEKDLRYLRNLNFALTRLVCLQMKPPPPKALYTLVLELSGICNIKDLMSKINLFQLDLVSQKCSKNCQHGWCFILKFDFEIR